jgi:hypothetical protein
MKNKRVLFAMISAVLVLLPLVHVAHPFVFMGRELSIRIVEAETGMPVEGAIVSATWTAQGEEGVAVAHIALVESVSNSDGWVYIPKWGPRFYFGPGRVEPNQPVIRVIHKMYAPSVLESGDRFSRISAVEPSVSLRRKEAISQIELVDAIERLMSSLSEVYEGHNCEWVNIPRTVLAVEGIFSPMRARGPNGEELPFNGIGNQARCGSAAELVRRVTS